MYYLNCVVFVLSVVCLCYVIYLNRKDSKEEKTLENLLKECHKIRDKKKNGNR